MKASEIRSRFLRFFEQRDHQVCPSGPLVPGDDPTLLFTNAGMVSFKKTFLGLEELPFTRAVTSQKCVRAGGKHNDLEQVGKTARHHTFFEMLGNFSFGDYFKREAIEYAWAFLTEDLGLEPERLFATVHHTDDEAAELWREVAGLPADRIYRLGDRDNFWQMADTGPCGPCSELHYDLRGSEQRGSPLSRDAFVEAGERGVFLELWNLVFMQFDRDEEGELEPLPAPSIDTGAGLERLASVLQEVGSNYHTDLFLPLLRRVAHVVGRPYEPHGEEGTSFRVLTDHARAVAFLLADGVFPSNEGRGYVLRRILRRAVRHAWLLGRREPTLVEVVDEVVATMGEAYPELERRREHLRKTTRSEEERFLSTIEGGLARFDSLAPELDEEARSEVEEGTRGEPVISGEEAFRLYDTFGFPLDLTELMAEERGYRVDVEGFEEALEAQRARSRADRDASGVRFEGGGLGEGWKELDPGAEQEFVGYEEREVETHVIALRKGEGRIGLQLRRNPFYAEGGGQVSDEGVVEGAAWRLRVEEVARVGSRIAVFGSVEEGTIPEDLDASLAATARVEGRRRHDTERNHTATHLLHAALREVLGEHVVQRGSLVAPDRLRFDFAHPEPVGSGEIEEIERRVNGVVWADLPVEWERMKHEEALDRGAIALFGEKYGEEVRVVRVPGVSMELCGGTHVRHTGEIGLVRIVRESGVAAGVRRVEALTGPAAYRHLREQEERLERLAELLRTDAVSVERRVEDLVDEKEELEKLLESLRREGGGGERVVAEAELDLSPGGTSLYRGVRMPARDAGDVRAWGDGFLDSAGSGVAVVAAELPEEKRALFAFVTDDLIHRGIRADELVRAVASRVGGKGGGRPHMAQAGVEEPEKVDEALAAGAKILEEMARAVEHG